MDQHGFTRYETCAATRRSEVDEQERRGARRANRRMRGKRGSTRIARQRWWKRAGGREEAQKFLKFLKLNHICLTAPPAGFVLTLLRHLKRTPDVASARYVCVTTNILK